MPSEASYFRREVKRLRQRLDRLECRLIKAEIRKMGKSEEERIEKLKEELRRAFPDMQFTPQVMSLLRLVGTEPYSPPSRDSKVIAEAIAKKYERKSIHRR